MKHPAGQFDNLSGHCLCPVILLFVITAVYAYFAGNIITLDLSSLFIKSDPPDLFFQPVFLSAQWALDFSDHTASVEFRAINVP